MKCLSQRRRWPRRDSNRDISDTWLEFIATPTVQKKGLYNVEMSGCTGCFFKFISLPFLKKTCNLTLTYVRPCLFKFSWTGLKPSPPPHLLYLYTPSLLIVMSRDTLCLSMLRIRGNWGDRMVINWQKVLKQAWTKVTRSLSCLIQILFSLLLVQIFKSFYTLCCFFLYTNITLTSVQFLHLNVQKIPPHMLHVTTLFFKY